MNKGYKIILRNYSKKFGEIDILALDPKSPIFIFFEVKSLFNFIGSSKNLVPEDNISRAKLRKIRRMAQFFANAHPWIIGDREWRIDFLAVRFDRKGRCRIDHYENVG